MGEGGNVRMGYRFGQEFLPLKLDDKPVRVRYTFYLLVCLNFYIINGLKKEHYWNLTYRIMS